MLWAGILSIALKASTALHRENALVLSHYSMYYMVYIICILVLQVCETILVNIYCIQCYFLCHCHRSSKIISPLFHIFKRFAVNLNPKENVWFSKVVSPVLLP